jgi:hypothetical protein
MVTSANTSLPIWLAGCVYDASGGNDLRNSSVTAMYYDQGIVSGTGGSPGTAIGVRGGVIGGAGLWCYPGTGMSFLVQPGSFVVPNSATPTAGGYAATLATQATLTVQTADPTNTRIDIVVAYVNDVGTSASFGAVAILTGVAAATPSAPTPPANSITLAQISVPAGTTTITSALITDKRPFTTATGGILVAPIGSVTGYVGQIAYDQPSGRFYHNNNNASSTQLRVLPWAPVITTQSTVFNWGGAETTVLSATMTTDGYTDVQIFFKWPGISSSHSGYNYNVVYRMYIDSTQVDGFFTPNDPADGSTHSGGSWSYFTSSTTGDTPSSGTHTVRVTAQNLSGNYSTNIYGVSTNKIILRVSPVSL